MGPCDHKGRIHLIQSRSLIAVFSATPLPYPKNWQTLGVSPILKKKIFLPCVTLICFKLYLIEIGKNYVLSE